MDVENNTTTFRWEEIKTGTNLNKTAVDDTFRNFEGMAAPVPKHITFGNAASMAT